MNRFLNRRKDKKKGEPEPKPELNIATALPAADDFRTSLILPGLSTRFSMLREQDDPHSKLGKASDDSVLHPKRQSRLHEFGFAPGGLTDIAEVSSLKGSLKGSLSDSHGPIRPPFASERSGSFDSQATEEGGSMMSRARPGEGNVLFGGRQKIYKIGGSGTSSGRLLYDDDVHLSTFQKMRREEKERLAAQQDDETAEEPLSPTKDAYSPSVEGFNRRRETSSSTNSGSNARISTAATSVASQGANSVAAGPTSPTEITRSTTKARRLYEQGLDQQMYEQQSSAMNRLNSIQRTRAQTGRATPPLLFTQTRSATNLSDRFTKGGALRMESPTFQTNPGFPNGKDSPTNASSPILSRPQSPLLTSPLASDSEDAQTLNTALQPQDRGKATAMGAFNKPKAAFSEEQYRERLRQMQLEREASAAAKLDNPRKTSADHVDPILPRKPSATERADMEIPKKPSLRERAELERRKRAMSNTTTAGAAMERERSDSSAKPKDAPSPFSVFQQAASQMKAVPATASSTPSLSPHNVQSPDSQQGATFFASAGSSEDEGDAPQPGPKSMERGRRLENLPVATRPAPPILEHPALRSRSNSRPPQESEHPALRSRSNSPPTQIEPQSSPNPQAAQDPDLDSPTLGPNNGGLSGLIRQHLRNVSNVSSNYDDDRQSMMNPPPLQTQNFGLGLQRRQPQKETDTHSNSTYNHSNPWDLDDLESNPFYNERASMSSVSPVDAPKPQSQAYPISPMSPLSPDAPTFAQEEDKTHHRGRSVEEHEAFQRDLALRQRAIQESLRARAEGRSTSPAPTPAGHQGGLKTALNMLRAKSSRESFATVDSHRNPDGSLKSIKVLGLGANSVNASSTSLAGVPEGSSVRHNMRSLPYSDRGQGEPRQRSATGDSTRSGPLQNRSPPTSSRGSGRDRSSSEVSNGRSRSRPPQQYRDDLQQAMGEGIGSRSAYYPPNSTPSMPGYSVNATQPLPAERSSPDQSSKSRSRSNSKKHLKPIQTGNGMPGVPGAHLSPGGRPQNSPGLPASPRPSPGGPSPAFRAQASPLPAASAANTPPVSNPGTPDKAAFNPDARPPPMAKVGTLRKKSIAKADIGEPVFVSTTSVIDLVSLPPGASLKNGMETAPPPVPPINPRRRFGFGRSENRDPGVHAGLDSPNAPFAEMRTNSYEGLTAASSRPALRKTMSEGRSLHENAQVQSLNSPPMPAGPFGARKASPPRPINGAPAAQRNMDGAMF
ncbi:hypothetical protein DPSP01_013523 [Paraphaeosphaeria sporulosa]|uniref:Uncharacterized protein n=1 Tax=Paraphaeosphaeria sporulosa TaxID=1460663 RepID=A0A177CK97_9PLEO|nr:uncharacterized protein CC84DRAFT_524414 [Paraphaeosphaeria sporulosa]OAG07954.1 hypothetical protein CC84DRAFT_524414 [Paraphaeosphaeria sporulosa]